MNSSGSCSFLGSNFEHFKVPKPKDSGLEKLYNHIERVSISSVGKNQVKGTLEQSDTNVQTRDSFITSILVYMKQQIM